MEQMITSDPEVMLGKPVIRGTRVTIELILNKLNAGERTYPTNARDMIICC